MSSPQRDQKRRPGRARSLPGKEQPGPSSSFCSPGFSCLIMRSPHYHCLYLHRPLDRILSFFKDRSSGSSLQKPHLILFTQRPSSTSYTLRDRHQGILPPVALETRAVTSACHVLCFNRCHRNRQSRGGPLETTLGTTALGN